MVQLNCSTSKISEISAIQEFEGELKEADHRIVRKIDNELKKIEGIDRAC
jgi:hypothetical protein